MDKLGKVLYGSVFCLLVPSLLVLWAESITFELPMFAPILGLTILVGGILLIVVSMGQLWFIGKGLPMNAYPPKYYVRSGLYFIFKHPIYIGFSASCFGISILFSSTAGFYLISPVVSLLCWSLVMGYEDHTLSILFPQSQRPILPKSISFWERFREIVPVFLFWSFGYETLVLLGYDGKYVDTTLWFEKNWPVIEWAELPYFLTYLFIFSIPWLVQHREQLTFFRKTSWWIVISGLLLQWLLPFYVEPKYFEPQTALGDLIIWERNMDSPAAAFPSFHVLWILTVSHLAIKVFQKHLMVWICIGGLLIWSCIATGAHTLLDVLAACVVYLLIINRLSIWLSFQNWCNKVGNSWRSFRIGPVRIISHVYYSALAGLAGPLIVGQFLSDNLTILFVVLGTWVGGIVWGQWIEGSSRLLRPFGYFGAITGGSTTAIIVSIFSPMSFSILLGAFALAAPWTQVIGRVRCLIQGCCHGKTLEDKQLGICIHNAHSRVITISNLQGVPIHNTQGYSMLSNFVIGLILLRLWYAGADSSILSGMYFILTGASRFVEEAYRGEQQTQKAYGLTIYQWLSVLSVLIGAMFTTLPGTTLVFNWNLSYGLLLTSLFSAVIWAFGMSIDFPNSKIPFSRLTG